MDAYLKRQKNFLATRSPHPRLDMPKLIDIFTTLHRSHGLSNYFTKHQGVIEPLAHMIDMGSSSSRTLRVGTRYL